MDYPDKSKYYKRVLREYDPSKLKQAKSVCDFWPDGKPPFKVEWRK